MQRLASAPASITVLLIEDNPADARLIKEFLRDSGTVAPELLYATSLTEGLRQIGANPIDVVLLDLGLPEGQGLETLQRFVAQVPQLPVVVLTGNEELQGEQALQAGAQDYLRKGYIDGDVLLRTLRYAIERAKLTQALRDNLYHLESSQQRWRTLVEMSADGVIVVDTSGVVRFINPTGASLLGAVLDQPLNQVFDPNAVASAPLELDITDASGAPRVVELCSAAIEWDGAPAFLCALRDISARKQMERFLQQAREDLEKKVEERTRELERVNRLLRMDVAELERLERTLHFREQRIKRQQEALPVMVRAIHRAANPDESLRLISELSSQVLQGVRRCTVWILEDSVLRRHAVYETHSAESALPDALEQTQYPTYFAALQAGRVLAATNVETHPTTQEFAAHYPGAVTALLDTPLRHEDKVIGVLRHEHPGASRRWEKDEVEFSSLVADLIALVVAGKGDGGR